MSMQTGFWKSWVRQDAAQDGRVGTTLGPTDGRYDSVETEYVHWQGDECYSVTVRVHRDGAVTVTHSTGRDHDGISQADQNVIHIPGWDPDDLTDLRPDED